MEMDLVLHLRYQAWATRLILDGVKQLSPEEYAKDRHSSHGGIQGTLSHIYQADSVWFSRLTGEPFASIHDVPVPATLDELGREWLTLLERCQKWMAQLTPNQFGIEVRYKNTAGISYSTPIWQVVMQMVNHSSFHRGQVVTMLRQAGAKPPLTDIIVFYRELDAARAAAS